MLPFFGRHFIYSDKLIYKYMFYIDVASNGTAAHFSVLVDGHDYETDHYNPWTHNNKFSTVGEAVAFKRELDSLVWDNEDRFDVEELIEETTPILYKKYGDCFQTYFHKRSYDVYLVEATCKMLGDTELRKHFIDEVLKQV